MRNWDEEYKSIEYVFGVEPNAFLVNCLQSVQVGKALCLGEGEGRNAVYLAQQGFEVTAVDISLNGLRKASNLAKHRGVALNLVQEDVMDFPIESETWELVICFFMHLPTTMRAVLHSRVMAGLKPGGVYLLEGFSPGQRGRDGTGPKHPKDVFKLAEIRQELKALELRVAEETERLLDEQKPELGCISVTRVMAVKSPVNRDCPI